MKLPSILAACVLAMPLSPSSAETESEAISGAENAARQAYVEKYSELLEGGKLDPPADKLPGKPDSLERRLWMAGYYSAVMEFLEPGKAEMAGGPALGHDFVRGGPRGYYQRGYISGQNATGEMAHKLYLKIRAKHLGDLDARLAREKREKAGKQGRDGEKEPPR